MYSMYTPKNRLRTTLVLKITNIFWFKELFQAKNDGGGEGVKVQKYTLLLSYYLIFIYLFLINIFIIDEVYIYR